MHICLPGHDFEEDFQEWFHEPGNAVDYVKQVASHNACVEFISDLFTTAWRDESYRAGHPVRERDQFV